MALRPTIFESAISAINNILSNSDGFDVGNKIDKIFPQYLEDIFENFGSVNIYETVENVIVEVQLPGFNKSQISLHVDNRILSILAERNLNIENSTSYQREFNRTKYDRKIELPHNTNVMIVSATMENGILTIKFGKMAQDSRMKITIS